MAEPSRDWPRPLPNLWLGVSVENQDYDWRITHLLQTPAAVRFVSYEPALSAINFNRIEVEPPGSGGTVFIDALRGKAYSAGGHWDVATIDWLICGGESGPKARPCDIAWIFSVVEQCKAAGTACFVKQLGSLPVSHKDRILISHKKGGRLDEWPPYLRVRQFPEAKV